ncbi:MAG: preprotein translocase subunit SecG [Rhodospirillales bacterium]|nr:preprotein translocase subunit SecG [Rhodospirillales bacterium]
MESVLLVVHLFLALAIIGLVLLQRSEGGGLGIGGGGGGLGGLATPQGTANLLTRATAVCAGLFFCTSLVLGILAGRSTSQQVSLMDALNETPASIEAPADEEQTQNDAGPSVPIAE